MSSNRNLRSGCRNILSDWINYFSGEKSPMLNKGGDFWVS
jgi:hypothetical protein